jgi:hypothetical protein
VLGGSSVCEICSGTGRTMLCPECGGDTIIGRAGCYELDCPRCHATGLIEEHNCLMCNADPDNEKKETAITKTH